MSKTKETWIAATAVSSRVGLPVVASPSGRLICNVNCAADPLHGKVPGDDAFNREALGHARLIAAAPELLAALQAQEKAEKKNANCPDCNGEGDWAECGRCSELFGDAIDLRHAAIAKAEGRS